MADPKHIKEADMAVNVKGGPESAEAKRDQPAKTGAAIFDFTPDQAQTVKRIWENHLAAAQANVVVGAAAAKR